MAWLRRQGRHTPPLSPCHFDDVGYLNNYCPVPRASYLTVMESQAVVTWVGELESVTLTMKL